MNCLRSKTLVLALAFAAVQIGCASRPEEELKLAQQAKDEAMAQRASEYAAGDWKDAEAAYKEAQSLISQESYGQARTMLLRAKSRYEKARDIAQSLRDDVLRRIKNLQGTIDLRYTNLKADIERNKGRISSSRRSNLDSACEEIDKKIEKLKALLDEGDYATADSESQEAMRKVYETEKLLQSFLGRT